MPSSVLIRCRAHVLTTIYQLARWEHCHMSRDTVWSHAPRASRVEFPQAAPDGPAPGSDILHSILIWQQKILWHQIGRWCRWCKKFKWFFQDVWFNVLMEFWMSGRNAVHCNILWFSIKFPGCSVRFIGDHNCVTPHCFPQIESEEEFSSDQDRPARYLLDRLPGNLTDYAIITHKIKIICISISILLTLDINYLSKMNGYVSLLKYLLQAYSQHHLCHCICQITSSWESKSNFQHFCLWIFRQVSF